MKEIAILGATASGKTSLAIDIAKEVNANILSLDSLSIYKEIDIVSAKPTIAEREGIKHFGIDEIYLDEPFSVVTFFDLYKKAKENSLKEGKHLIIVGGTSFYLKSMIEGLSVKLSVSDKTKQKIKKELLNLDSAFSFIEKKDPTYASKISSHDGYRIEKWYEIYFESGKIATEYFTTNEKKAIASNIEIFDILIDREELREKHQLRTKQMIENGLIDEIFYLEKKYTRLPKPMGAIGIKETFSYFDGKINKKELFELISIHTAQLAKRQETFNKSQFPQRIKLLKKDLRKKISKHFN
jgi:tRNA dimethylallyltransferase